MVDKIQLIKDYRAKYNSSLLEAKQAIESCIAMESVHHEPRTLRDYYAGQALVGFLSCGIERKAINGVEMAIDEACFEMADAMLKGRSKHAKNN